MKKIVYLLCCIFLAQSCIPVCTLETMKIVNCTNDTILIGYDDNNTIDSLRWFIDRWIVRYDSSRTVIEFKKDLSVSNNNLIPHDSIGCFARTSLFSDFTNNRIIFFVIKWDDAKNNSWDNICKKRLYDTLVVVPEMVEKEHIIEYKGKN